MALLRVPSGESGGAVDSLLERLREALGSLERGGDSNARSAASDVAQLNATMSTLLQMQQENAALRAKLDGAARRDAERLQLLNSTVAELSRAKQRIVALERLVR